MDVALYWISEREARRWPCLHGKRSAAIDDRSFSSFSGELEEVIAFW